MDELSAIETWATTLLRKLEAPARRKAMRAIAVKLRRSQQGRIAQQRNPDNSAYTPRKPRPKKHLRDKAGRIKRKAMFAKLRQARYLRVESDAQGLAIGFMGRIARVARVHQLGERDRVARNGPEYKYPARVLLGFSNADRDMIRNELLNHITE
ncbi:phage virion morphogenesis protein [Paraburkholderia sediminicola]|uniref:phage virion morphogenesis protein n=1 Tax=Paraburkholderia sediminicola TaxID=458836 RepID=UPI0038B6F201